MKKSRFSQLASLFAGMAALFLIVVSPAGAGSGSLSKPRFNSKGELVRPTIDFREWVYIGTPLTPNDLNPPEAAFPDFHNVYIHPDDFEHWKATGEFPDGTVIVKELVSVGSKSAVSGQGYFMGEFIGLETTIKDSVRFKDEPGNWAYFSFGHSYPLADTAAPLPTVACNSCHMAAAADDYVFTQYYPVLRAARDSHRTGETMKSGSEKVQKIVQGMSAALDRSFQSTAPTGAAPSEVPTEKARLFSYLQSREYRSLAASESETHPSIGPHTRAGLPVRVYMNALLEESLKAGNSTHPAGSASVKEMFDEGGELQGWAVMVKTDNDSSGGKGWFWYEITSTTDGSSPVGIGNGIPLCTGCHGIGKDYVLTRYPLK